MNKIPESTESQDDAAFVKYMGTGSKEVIVDNEALLNLIGLIAIERVMWPEPECDPEKDV